MPEASYPAFVYGFDDDPMEGWFATKKTGSWVSKAMIADAWPEGLVIDEQTIVVGNAGWPLQQALKSIDYGDSWTGYETPIWCAYLFIWEGVLYGLRSNLSEITTSSDGGQTWTEETAFFPGTWNLNYGTVFLDAEGRFHVSYVVGTGEDAEWRYRRSDDLGSSWEDEKVLAIAGEFATYSPFSRHSIVARDGHVFVSCDYSEYDSKLVQINGSQLQYYYHYAILVAYSHDVGDSWGGPVTVEDWTVPYGPTNNPPRWLLTDSRLCTTSVTLYQVNRARWTGSPSATYVRDWRCTNWTAGVPSFSKAQEVAIGQDIIEVFVSTRWDPTDDRFVLLYVSFSAANDALYEWTKAGGTTKIADDADLAWGPWIATFAPLLQVGAYTYFF